LKKIILFMTLVAMLTLSVPAMAEEFAYYNENTICVYAEPGESAVGKNVSVMLFDETTGLPAHAGECVVDTDGTYFYKFEFKTPVGKKLEENYELRVRVEDGELKNFVVTEKPDNVMSFKVSVVDDALRNSTVKIKNLFENKSAYDFFGARKNVQGRLEGTKIYNQRVFSYGWKGQSEDVVVPYINNGTTLSSYIWDKDMRPMAEANAYTGETISKFEDGDVVSIAGDSIVHLSSAPAVIEHFYQTREPDKNIRVINTGVGGDVVGGKIGNDDSFGILSRLEWDVYHENPNKIFINSGTNDLLFSLYSPGNSDTTTGYRSIRYNSCLENYKNFIDKVKTDGKEITVLGEASIYDEDNYEGASVAENIGFNSALVKLNSDVMNIAEEKSVEHLNMNKYFNEITDNYRKENPDAPALHKADRIHLTDAGSFVYGAMILIHQGVDARVAETEIDALNANVNAYNAEVTVNDCTPTSVSYNYAPKAIPMAANAWYKDAEKIIPVTDYLNQEIIKVSNLESGDYVVEYKDVDNNSYVLGTYSNDELGEGINVAVNENNPSQKQALSAMAKQEQRFYYDMGTVRKTIQDSEERQTTGTMSQENINALNEMKAISKGYSDDAKALSVPKQYVVTITKVIN